MSSSHGSSAHNSGFSLMEVLIAIAILAIGLLSVAALQIQGVRQNFDSYARSQAVMLANDYVERMYANKVGADTGGYAGFDSNAVDCGGAPASLCGTQSDAATPAVCTAADLATYDRWIVACGYLAPSAPGGRFGGVRDLLQSGRMQVNCLDAAGAVIAPPCPVGARHQVAMSWVEQIKDDANRSSAVTTDDLVVTVQP